MKLNANVVNGLSLMVIQGANALFPLLVFPYLLGVLGADAFAELVVAEALAFYVLAICLYSFDTSGVLAIIEARNRNDKLKEAESFFNIVCSRIALFFISSLPLVGIYYLFSDGSVAILLAWLAFVLGMILQNNYYFQAIESNWLLAAVVLFSRFSGVVAIYLFVDGEKDVLLASAILGGSFLLSGMAALVLLLSRFGLNGIRVVSVRVIIKLLYEGRHLFFGNVSVTLFRGANILILAGVSNNAAVSTYALAEKVIKSIQALSRPLNQLFVPKAVKAWSTLNFDEKNNKKAFSLIWKNTRIQLFLMLFILPLGVLSLYFSHAWWGGGGFSDETMGLISLMAPAVIFGVANAMFGAVGLSLIGAQSYFASSVFSVGVSIFIFSMIMSYYYAAFGAASAFVLAELLLLMLFLRKYLRESARG